MSKVWFETPQAACEDNAVFFNPNSNSSGPEAIPSNAPNWYSCYANNGSYYLGSIQPSPCSGIHPVALAASGLTCIDPDQDTPDKDDGTHCGVGNPCRVDTQSKIQFETDFSTGGMTFVRTYSSRNLVDRGLGKGWRHSFQPHLVVSGSQLTRVTSNGGGEPWSKVGGVWQGDPDSKVLISETVGGLELIKGNGAKELYSLEGQLLKTTDVNGNETVFTYNGVDVEQLDAVTGHYGHGITLSYSLGRLASVTDTAGNQYQYKYVNNNLTEFIYPDDTPNDDADNLRKVYHYENPTYPNHLTGITDENGDRYATFSYAPDGRATSTEHSTTTNSVGQEKFTLDLQ